MAKFKVEIDTDNAAFEDDLGTEIARILTGVIRDCGQLSHGHYVTQSLRDTNGNRVGKFTYAK
jgi:hypothetical protein